MQVWLLGPVRAFDGDRELDLGGPMNRALVARLALAAGRPVGAATLIDDLWAEDVPADATNALQSIVSRTRRRLPEGALVSAAGGYVLHADVDAEQFRALASAGRSREALALWRGDALADLPDLPFAQRVTAPLEQARLAALEQDLASRRPDAAVVAELAELTRAHPYRDGLWLLYLQALVADGRPSEALTAYETLRERLADDLGADPSPQLRAFHTGILRGEVAGPQRHRNALPTPLTSFVGRDQAVEELRTALERHRLVTILGPGGAGKTRLAVETARACADRIPRVWFVELATVTEDDDLVPAVLSAMGLLEISVLDRPGPPPTSPRARLLEGAADAEGLLVLDNCEHLVEAAAQVAEQVLAHGPRLRVLATSREALQLIGEYGYPVVPLTLPDATATPAEALAFSAVRLFTERAQAVDQSFALNATTLPAVLEICRRLDGQPLAIELAAARLRTLAIQDVAARLSDRFRLLTGGSRTLPRHRTLRAVVEWSWDLLSDAERDLAERVAVFPAGVTPDGAAAVFDGAGGTGELLDSLAEKSLLVPDRQARRYRMLETLREYGVERLVERGLVEKVRSAHLDHFLAVAEDLARQMAGPQQVEAIRTTDLERGNLTAAARFAVDRSDRSRAGRILVAMLFYFAIRNEHNEMNSLIEAVMPLPGEAEPEVEIPLAAVGLVGLLVGPPPDAAEHRSLLVGRILRLWDTHRPDDDLTLIVMAALQHFELTGDRQVPAPRDRWARSLIGVLRLAMMENFGRTQDVGALLDETIEGFIACGDSWGLAASFGLRGAIAAYDGAFERAAADWRQALPLLVDLGADQDAAFCRLRLLGVELLTADPARLERLRRELGAELAAATRQGLRQDQAFARLGLAQVEHYRGDEAAAALHLGELLADLSGVDPFSNSQLEAATRSTYAMALAACGDAEGARAQLRTAVTMAVHVRDMPVLAGAVGAGAVLARSLDGDAERAARLLGSADALRGRPDRSNRNTEVLAQQLREHLGAAPFDVLFAEGLALSQDAAVALITGDR